MVRESFALTDDVMREQLTEKGFSKYWMFREKGYSPSRAFRMSLKKPKLTNSDKTWILDCIQVGKEGLDDADYKKVERAVEKLERLW